MMSRLRIAGRLALIVVGGIVLVQMLMIAVYFVEQRERRERIGFAAPFLGQMAALVQALDRVPAADRELVSRAATTPRVMLRIRRQIPEHAIDSPFFAAAEQRLRGLIGPPDDRFMAISLVTEGSDGEQPVSHWRDLVGARLHALIGLNSGGYLEIETSSDLSLLALGIPVGLIAGILGFVVALAALIAVRRETRPLSELALAIERFAEAVEAKPITERGAPDVRTLIRAVNAMQARIAELLRSRTLVLGAISHDLRTYVTRLRLRLELLPRSDQCAKAAADLDGMQSLMDDALAFARASFAVAPDETVDLAHVARAEFDARSAQSAPVSLSGAQAPL
ncbi:HAMP domain-containing protein, partial [Bradyrhizobium sp.]|uniref:HAMP domain-containing protein n=1 Tax=Bradyrhizobium sp. TaxID=376 RepID=UPI003C5DFEDA